MPLTEADYQSLRLESLDESSSYLLDSHGLDAVFFLYSTCLYVAVRLLCNWRWPGLHESGATAAARKHTVQQYIVLFAQKGFVLPVCALGWYRCILPPELLYLLTGAYVLSDSMVNHTPVRGGSWGGTTDHVGAGRATSSAAHASV